MIQTPVMYLNKACNFEHFDVLHIEFGKKTAQKKKNSQRPRPPSKSVAGGGR
jgi:hypothetical protein